MCVVGIPKYAQYACLARFLFQWSTEQPRQVILMILYAEEMGRSDKQNKQHYFIEQKKNLSLKGPWKTMQKSDRFWSMDSKAKRGRKENISVLVGN